MQKLVSFLVSSLVDNPKDVKVEESDSGGLTTLVLEVADSDMGRIIGRGGKIISAIRELVKVKAIKTGKRVKLILKDPRQTVEDYQSAPSAEPSQS